MSLFACIRSSQRSSTPGAMLWRSVAVRSTYRLLVCNVRFWLDMRFTDNARIAADDRLRMALLHS